MYGCMYGWMHLFIYVLIHICSYPSIHVSIHPSIQASTPTRTIQVGTLVNAAGAFASHIIDLCNEESSSMKKKTEKEMDAKQHPLIYPIPVRARKRQVWMDGWMDVASHIIDLCNVDRYPRRR